MKISQMMTKAVRTCQPTDTLATAAQLMWEHDVGALPVVDQVGHVIGMLTDRDACMAAYTRGEALPSIPVSAAMARYIVTCRADATDVAIARVMAANKIRRVPVVDGEQRLIGIVSLHDLAGSRARGRDIPAKEIAKTLAAISEPRPVPTAVEVVDIAIA